MVSWKGGLALLVVLAGLAAYLLLSRPQPAKPTPALLPCGVLDTVYLRIEGQGRTLELERADPRSDWELRRPQSGPADRRGVTFLLSAVDSIKVLNSLPPSSDDAAFGLAQPREVLECRIAAGPSYNLSIGNRSFDGSGYYARKGGDNRVYVISSVEVDDFDRALGQPPVKPTPSP